MRLAPRQVHARSDAAWGRKQLWYGELYRCYRYALPGRNPYHEGRRGLGSGGAATSPGSRRNDEIYDSTLIEATQRLANRVQSAVFPTGQDWAQLRPGPALRVGGVASDRAVGGKLRELQAEIFASIHSSNFALELGEALLELVATGTCCLLVQRAEANANSRVGFEHVSQAEVALEGGPGNSIWGVYRKDMLTRDMVRARWPGANLEGWDEDEDIERDGVPRPRSVEEACYWDLDSLLWRYVVLLPAGDDMEVSDEPLVIHESEYVYSPWVIGRWSRGGGEVQGRSPVMAALPTQLTMDKAVEFVLKNASMRLAGMFAYSHGGVMNPKNLSVKPGTWIAVRQASGPQASVARLDVGGDLHMSQFVLQELREQVKGIMLDEGLPEESAGIRSATEIVERVRALQQDLGSPYNRIIQELGIPILQRTLHVLTEADPGLGMGTAGTVRLGGAEVAVEFTGPLALAQRFVESETLTQWLQLGTSLVGPEAVNFSVRTENVMAKFAELLDVDRALLRDEDERRELMEASLHAAQSQMEQGGENAAP